MHASRSFEKSPLFCLRCGAELTPGEGNFYVIRIEAFVDPTPPDLTIEQSSEKLAAEIDSLIYEMQRLSEQELLDQVHRRMTIYLCWPCYRDWIEQPVG